MNSLEWMAVYVIAGVGTVGFVLLLIGRLVGWRREAKREPLRTPSRFLEFSVGGAAGPLPSGKAAGEDTAGKGAARTKPMETAGAAGPRLAPPGGMHEAEGGKRPGAQRPASDRSGQGGRVSQPRDTARLVEDARPLRSSPKDLFPPDPSGGGAGPGRSALGAAEAKLDLQESQLREARSRFAHWSAAASDALLESLNEHNVDSEEDLPPEAGERLGRQQSALDRLAEELHQMERSVKRKTAALEELRQVMQRSTESGWGRKLEA